MLRSFKIKFRYSHRKFIFIIGKKRCKFDKLTEFSNHNNFYHFNVLIRVRALKTVTCFKIYDFKDYCPVERSSLKSIRARGRLLIYPKYSKNYKKNLLNFAISHSCLPRSESRCSQHWCWRGGRG